MKHKIYQEIQIIKVLEHKIYYVQNKQRSHVSDILGCHIVILMNILTRKMKHDHHYMHIHVSIHAHFHIHIHNHNDNHYHI